MGVKIIYFLLRVIYHAKTPGTPGDYCPTSFSWFGVFRWNMNAWFSMKSLSDKILPWSRPPNLHKEPGDRHKTRCQRPLE
jgi:hypothetical protein